ncbi:MAG: thymidine phosphorylase family protein [Deltaproteobacteria bacterium]|nr:thymidine phosphorylase family protein [Deltaproteobacteria bacterium]
MSHLVLRKVGIDTYHENVAYLPMGCEICKSQGFGALSKIQIHGGGHSILATLNMTENGLVSPGEIGLSHIAMERLGLTEGSHVTLSHPNPLISFEFVRQKLDGGALDKAQFLAVLRDIVAYRYSNIELTAFLIACSQQRLSEEEITYLTEAMIETGELIDWGLPLVLDKHCIGGIPGNRTTMIIVPIVAAFGLPIPKTSSRAITSPSGTADTMETIANVRLSLAEMRRIVTAENACIAWGGALALAPADDILISVERPLSLDSEGQMIASIISKKRAAGSDHLLLDIPIGPTAKVTSLTDGEALKLLFEKIGGRIGLKTRIVFTDGTQPVGRGIGPALEALDVLQVLQNQPGLPEDLKEKSIFLAGELLEFSGKLPKGQGAVQARRILESGKAWEKFQNFSKQQGNFRTPHVARLSHVVPAPRAGTVKAIHNQKISMAAKLAGAPQDPGAGIYLESKIGDSIRLGDPLFKIYSESSEELGFALDYIAANPDLYDIQP